jgi:hypothetical protein
MTFPNLSGSTSDGALTYSLVRDIRQLWPVVLPGIQKIKQDDGWSWIPEDIYAAIATGNAAMYVFRDPHGKHVGFAVYQVIPMEFESAPALNIWLGHAEAPDQGKYGVEVSRLIAGEMGLERIVFSTTQQSAWLKPFRLLKAYYEV